MKEFNQIKGSSTRIVHKIIIVNTLHTVYFGPVYIFTQGGTLLLKLRGGGAGLIVWGLGFWLGKDVLGFFKNIDLDNS